MNRLGHGHPLNALSKGAPNARQAMRPYIHSNQRFTYSPSRGGAERLLLLSLIKPCCRSNEPLHSIPGCDYPNTDSHFFLLDLEKLSVGKTQPSRIMQHI